jgi:hypothetical protein
MTRESREMMKQVKLIFATIIKFCKTQEHLYTTSLKEVHEAKLRQQAIERRTLEVLRYFHLLLCEISGS